MRKWTLQWRITFIIGLLLLICSMMMTVFSIKNADNSFDAIIDKTLPKERILPLSTLIVDNNDSITKKSELILPAMINEQQGIFEYNSVVACIAVTIVGTVAAYFLSGISLKPVKILNLNIDGIDETNLSYRLNVSNSKDEVGRLTENFNNLLFRLEDAFARQKEFNANATHELKTPLAILKSSIQTTDNLDKDFSNNLIEVVNRMDKIIDSLLILSTEKNSTDLIKEEIDLDVLIEALIDEYALKLSQKNMEFIVEGKEIMLKTYPDFLYRALSNLIENAYKYGHVGGLIKIETTLDSKVGVVIEVIDNGIGIAEENLPYIFDTFYRIDKSRSRIHGGSGLGLSIVKKTIEFCNGDIEVFSEFGEGTVFKIVLPMKNS